MIAAVRTSARRRAACLAAAACLLGACGPPEPEAPPAPPHLVLISIDSLRADRVGCYGAERDTSPAIDALAARGIRFENAVAPTSWTLPSHVTLLSGLPIPAHRVIHPEMRIDPARELLAQHLAANGYDTGGFVSAPLLSDFYGFQRGFDRYLNFGAPAGATGQPTDEQHAASHHDETAPQVIDAALGWLAERPAGGARPWFLFVHLWDVHYDFLPPPPFDRMFDPDYEGDLDPRDFQDNPAIHDGMPARDLAYLKALYDGEIRWLDSQLGRLLAELERRAGEERIVVALVADHGDEFFEHGHKGHYRTLFEESVRVPFLLVDPGRLAPRVERAVVGLDDVAPTLLGLAGLPPMSEALGRDLAPDLEAGTPPEGAKLLHLWPTQALRGDGWKVVFDGHTNFAGYYDLTADPGERHPLPARTHAPERLAALIRAHHAAEAHAERLRWTPSEGEALSPELEERLRELGYLE